MVVLGLFIVSLVACGMFGGGDDKKTDGNKQPGDTNKPSPTGTLKASDIKIIADLSDYGKNASDYNKDVTTYDAASKSYAGKDCSEQLTKLKNRIDEKHQDVIDGDSTSAFIKIFAMSTAEELLQRMANAALTYDEMDRVVEYLSGTKDADIETYLAYTVSSSASEDNDAAKVWSGKFAMGELWRSLKVDGKQFNDGWSFFDDWELYDRLEDYADTKGMDEDKKNDAEDNAAWQYRSILQKVYEEVQLDGAPAARLATHMLDYAVLIIEEKSGDTAENAIGSDNSFGAFAEYCKRAPSETDPFSGLQDYDTLSYLLAFNSYYTGNNGLINCVRLYGYYYDYNERYYNKSLKDEETYAKQLKYEKMSVFTDAEWQDYVLIQRNNYENAYRYGTAFYRTFYTYHFEFQGIIENFDEKVYLLEDKRVSIGATDPKTTYTTEMKTAIREGSIDGLAGQLAMSDWMWCYGGDTTAMTNYNNANTKYENGKEGSAEEEYEGKFDYEMEQLKLIKYLFLNMEDQELSGALYYQVYAYSASMVKKMQTYMKNIVYICDAVEPGSEFTKISATAISMNKSNDYAQEKIKVLYDQAYTNWYTADVSTKGRNANTQSWGSMETEIDTAIGYDYENMEITQGKKGEWEQKVERLEDLVIARKWSCCGQKVSEPNTKNCPHATNSDGTIATKEYDTDHKISMFVSNYEEILFHIAGNVTLSFQTPVQTEAKPGYQTKATEEKTWKAGYDGTIRQLRNSELIKKMEWEECKSYTISAGEEFVVAVEDAEDKDRTWWSNNKVGTTYTDSKDRDYPKKNTSDGIEIVETTPSGNITFIYTYEFVGWYLDKDCMYEFDEEDEVEINLNIYAGYNVTKTKKS